MGWPTTAGWGRGSGFWACAGGRGLGGLNRLVLEHDLACGLALEQDVIAATATTTSAMTRMDAFFLSIMADLLHRDAPIRGASRRGVKRAPPDRRADLQAGLRAMDDPGSVFYRVERSALRLAECGHIDNVATTYDKM